MKPAGPSTPAPHAGRARPSWIAGPGGIGLLLALVTLAVYFPVVHNSFVAFDDQEYVTANQHVLDGLKWSNVAWAFTTGHASNWHPLTWISHMVDCQIFGLQPGPQHAVNLAFHLANVVLLFLVLRLMTGALWRSALVAAVLGLHPTHVESVAWIAERKDVLCTFFILLTFWAYTRYVRAGRGRTRWYAGALCFHALALMSKPMAVTLPFVLLLLDDWPLGRFASVPGARRRQVWRRALLEKAAFLALSMASSIVTLLVQHEGGAFADSLPVPQRIANALVSYCRYIGKTFWPARLSILYPHPGEWPAAVVALSVIALAGLCALALTLGRKRRYLTTGWWWFLGTLVPVIGLIQVGSQAMADRYTYLPMIGLSIAVIWGLAEVVERRPRLRTAAAAATVLALAGCSWATNRQVGVWKDSEVLFRHAIAVTQGNYRAYNNLGFYLSAQGRTAEAVPYYRRSLEINPLNPDALNNVGYSLAGEGKTAEALPYYEKSLHLQPGQAEVRINYGDALCDLGRAGEAIEQYKLALAKDPENASAHNGLGIALALQGRLEEAVPQFRTALRLKPIYAGAHQNLANTLTLQHDLAGAESEYREVLRLTPNNAQAHGDLGRLLADQGRKDEAAGEFREVLRLDPEDVEARKQLQALPGR